jgi:hypothetical protein
MTRSAVRHQKQKPYQVRCCVLDTIVICNNDLNTGLCPLAYKGMLFIQSNVWGLLKPQGVNIEYDPLQNIIRITMYSFEQYIVKQFCLTPTKTDPVNKKLLTNRIPPAQPTSHLRRTN